MGFECVEAGFSNPIVGRYSNIEMSMGNYANEPVTGLYAHVGLLAKYVEKVDGFEWKNVDMGKLVGNTRYPG